MEFPSILISGTLLLGVGDSMASIVGSRFGKTYWLPSSDKSVEGTFAAIIAMVL